MLAIHSGKLFRSTNNDEEKFLLFDSHLNKVIKVSEESHIKFLGKTRFFFSTLTCKSLKKKKSKLKKKSVILVSCAGGACMDFRVC